MDKKKYLVMRKVITPGIIVFGGLLIITSILQMQKFVSFDVYRRVFAQLPYSMITLRFFVSVMLRISGFLAGIGLLLRRDFARKLALGIAVFTICTLYWKHPYFVVYNYYKIAFFLTNSPSGAGEFVIPHNLRLYTILTLAVFYLIDIVFFGSLIYYFTRSRVKALFH